MVKAIHAPSGLKFGEPRRPSIWKASPAGRSMRRNQVPPPPPGPGLLELKTSSLPSGLHLGPDALKAGLVTRNGSAEPSAAASQISLWRPLSSSSTEVTT